MKKEKFPVDKSLPDTLSKLIKERCAKFADYTLQASKNKEGKFEYFTFAEVYEKVIELALAYKTLGIKKDSHVALISDNRREWLICDYALLCLGACDVPRGCDSLGKELRFIISFADCEVGIFENARQLKKITENIQEVPLLKTAIIFDPVSDEDMAELNKSGLKIISFEDLMKTGHEIYESDKAAKKAEIEADIDNVKPEDVVTMIFTSGTTGTPKGVMLTHANYISEAGNVKTFLPTHAGEMWLSVLPVWHVFERIAQYIVLIGGSGLAYSKPVASVMLNDMNVIRPHWIFGVPRLWEALAKGVNQAMKKKGGITFKLFTFFKAVGTHYANNRDRVTGKVCRIQKRNRFLDALVGIVPFILLWPLHKIGDALVFSKLKQKFGGRLRFGISGGGALQPDIENFYRAAGIKLLEGYGLTETTPVISVRYYKEARPGCVGAIWPNWEVKTVKEEHGIPLSGEPLPPGQQGLIFVRGPQLMKGYYKNPELTEKAIDKDGWFNTGDLGIITWDNELKITGRAKDTIVLLGGENIEPLFVESGLLASDYIESAMLLGQDQKYLGVLIVPNKDAVTNYAQTYGVQYSDYNSLLETQLIKDLFTAEISTKVSVENGYRPCEKINKFVLVADSFKVGEELSGKQEMMRYKIAEKYADLIATMFKE